MNLATRVPLVLVAFLALLIHTRCHVIEEEKEGEEAVPPVEIDDDSEQLEVIAKRARPGVCEDVMGPEFCKLYSDIFCKNDKWAKSLCQQTCKRCEPYKCINFFGDTYCDPSIAKTFCAWEDMGWKKDCQKTCGTCPTPPPKKVPGGKFTEVRPSGGKFAEVRPSGKSSKRDASVPPVEIDDVSSEKRDASVPPVEIDDVSSEKRDASGSELDKFDQPQ